MRLNFRILDREKAFYRNHDYGISKIFCLDIKDYIISYILGFHVKIRIVKNFGL